MKARLSKNTMLALYCYCRQAERSIHFALSSPKQWAEFVAFYDEQKRRAIANLIGMLNTANSPMKVTVNRQTFSRSIPSAILHHLLVRLGNKVKQTWSFSANEVSFLCSTLDHLLKTISRPMPPDHQDMINLRMNLCECESIIAWKIIGLPELKKAQNIEHFNQSDYAEHITLRELGVDNSTLLPIA